VNGTVSGVGAGAVGQSDVTCGALYEYKGIKEITYPDRQTGQMNVKI
jgi:hypothetical protein